MAGRSVTSQLSRAPARSSAGPASGGGARRGAGSRRAFARGRGRWRGGGGGGGGGARAGAARGPLARQRDPRRSRGVPPCGPHPSSRPDIRRLQDGCALREDPGARTGFLLLLLLLGLVAPGAQGARSRGGTEKNSYRRTVNTFSQSVSGLFGEDNVRAAQKVGAGPAPAVTLLRPPRAWRPGPLGRARPRGCRPARLRKGRPGSGAWVRACRLWPEPGLGQRRVWGRVPAQVWCAGPRRALCSMRYFSLNLAPEGTRSGPPSAALTPPRLSFIHSTRLNERLL